MTVSMVTMSDVWSEVVRTSKVRMMLGKRAL
jgi:hypothetical protein